MKAITTLSTIAALLTANSVHGSRISERSDAAPKVLSQKLARNQHASSPADLDRRLAAHRKRQANGVTVPLENNIFLYYTNITVGTPPQPFLVHLDTGSSDLWLNYANSDFCTSPQEPCDATGTYIANDSSTYEFVNSGFQISYVDGSQSAGDYARDTLTLFPTPEDGDEEVVIPAQQFGIGYESSTDDGILGIGYMANEVQVAYGGQPYPNLPQSLVDEGFINTNAYSIWLNDVGATEGELLFGGVDTAKYTGDLVTLPIVPTRGVYRELTVLLTGVGLNSEAEAFSGGEINEEVHLDTGASLTYLPDDIAEAMYERFEAVYNEAQGAYLMNCNPPGVQDLDEEYISFRFADNLSIRVSLREMILPFATNRATGQQICFLGVLPGASSPFSDNDRQYLILGDTFLRSAYVVYDLERNEISMAQTVFGTDERNVVEITAEGSLPQGTAAEGASRPSGGVSGTVADDEENAAVTGKQWNTLALVAALIGVLVMGL